MLPFNLKLLIIDMNYQVDTEKDLKDPCSHFSDDGLASSNLYIPLSDEVLPFCLKLLLIDMNYQVDTEKYLKNLYLPFSDDALPFNLNLILID